MRILRENKTYANETDYTVVDYTCDPRSITVLPPSHLVRFSKIVMKKGLDFRGDEKKVWIFVPIATLTLYLRIQKSNSSHKTYNIFLGTKRYYILFLLNQYIIYYYYYYIRLTNIILKRYIFKKIPYKAPGFGKILKIKLFYSKSF